MKSKSQTRRYLKTISTALQIHNHPTNTSKSKQLYSFSKTSRFRSAKNFDKIKDTFYDINPKHYRSQRACSFGIGSRRVFFDKRSSHMPGPSQYTNVVNTIKQQLKFNKGKTFGYSRDKCIVVGEKTLKEVEKVPGPGFYKIQSVFNGKDSRSFSLKGKININKENLSNMGPGKYDIKPTIGKEATLFCSQYKNNNNSKFLPLPQFNTHQNKKNQMPEIYDTKHEINKNGKYFNSKYLNSKLGLFGKSRKYYQKTRIQNPGPGTYVMPSDFGIYQSSCVANTQLIIKTYF